MANTALARQGGDVVASRRPFQRQWSKDGCVFVVGGGEGGVASEVTCRAEAGL